MPGTWSCMDGNAEALRKRKESGAHGTEPLGHAKAPSPELSDRTKRCDRASSSMRDGLEERFGRCALDAQRRTSQRPRQTVREKDGKHLPTLCRRPRRCTCASRRRRSRRSTHPRAQPEEPETLATPQPAMTGRSSEPASTAGRTSKVRHGRKEIQSPVRLQCQGVGDGLP